MGLEKYFISELKLIKEYETPELVEPEDKKDSGTIALRFKDSWSVTGKEREKLRLQKILKRLN